MNFYAELEQLGNQYEQMALQERMKFDEGDQSANPEYWEGVATGVRLAAAQVQKLYKQDIKTSMPPEVAAYWDYVDQQHQEDWGIREPSKT
jgi:hypothetical protein